MKTLLVLDDIESCCDCPCCNAETGFWGDVCASECQVVDKENLVYLDAVNGRPEWCPLSEMADKTSIAVLVLLKQYQKVQNEQEKEALLWAIHRLTGKD